MWVMRSSMTVPSTSSTPKHREIWASLAPQHHPEGLDVGEVVQHQAGNRQGLQIVDGAGAGEVAQAGVLGWKARGMKARNPRVSSCASLNLTRWSTLSSRALHMAVKHGGVGVEVEAVGHLGHLDPALGRKLFRAETGPYPGLKTSAPPPGRDPESRLFQGRQGVGNAHFGLLRPGGPPPPR